MKKKVAVLGATGSIGKSTLDILRNERDRFTPVLFSARRNSQELVKLKTEFPEALTALADSSYSPGIDFFGKDGLLNAIAASGADITVNGISGSAGLLPSAAVLDAKSDLALANKETIVMAGNIIQKLARENNVSLIPVDSEHSAIFKLIEAHGKEHISEIILTASGGPFRNYPIEKLENVSPEEALNHPTWNMGPKITIDSATLANKGLEVIEAACLFGIPPPKIKVVIHKQSIVHSMVRLLNGAVYAQMSKPDMRLPIHDALCWPETEKSPFGVLDFSSLSLDFESCDFSRFPMLALAFEALEKGPDFPIVYNAANEEAVEAFLKGRIRFLEIPRIVRYVLDKSSNGVSKPGTVSFSMEDVLKADGEGRKLALDFIGTL